MNQNRTINLLVGHNPWWEKNKKVPNRYRGQRPRRIISTLEHHLFSSETRRAAVVIGPRQVGKTSLLYHLVERLLQRVPARNITYFDFSDDRLKHEPISPRSIIEQLPAQWNADYPRFLLLDEIGHCTEWSAWLKQAVDKEDFKIIVTDSAASLLRTGGRESGAGRWDDYLLEGLDLREFIDLQTSELHSFSQILNNDQPYEKYLRFGGFPEHIKATSASTVRDRIRDAIVDKAIYKDISRAGVRDIDRLKDLFMYLVENSGAQLNAEGLAGDIGVDARTLRSWIEILVDSHLVVKLNGWASGPASRLKRTRKPKLYAVDHGLVTALSLFPEPLEHKEVKGRVFETAVFSQLRSMARIRRAELAFVPAQRSGAEIDFALLLPDAIHAIEVTSSSRYRQKPRAIRKSAEGIGATRRTVIYGGLAEQEAEGAHLVPLHRFLLDPYESLGLKRG